MLAFVGYLRHETDGWEGIQAVAILFMCNLPKWIMETLQLLHVYSTLGFCENVFSLLV
jgi:hypothetical protein